MMMVSAARPARDGDVLAEWAQSLTSQIAGPSRGRLRFAFYGRVSTEDWQDPVTSRARQLQQAVMLVAGHGVIVAEFFDIGESRTLPWARRPQAAALVAQLADPDRGWDAIVIGEYERAFYASQYASMAPLFEHYGVGLWMPEVGGRVDWHAEDHEQTMLALGLSSKREITRTRIRVRTAMAAQTREEGRYLGGRPPYGYRLGGGGAPPEQGDRAPGWQAAVWVPAGGCRAASEQGARRLGAPGAQAYGPDHPCVEVGQRARGVFPHEFQAVGRSASHDGVHEHGQPGVGDLPASCGIPVSEGVDEQLKTCPHAQRCPSGQQAAHDRHGGAAQEQPGPARGPAPPRPSSRWMMEGSAGDALPRKGNSSITTGTVRSPVTLKR